MYCPKPARGNSLWIVCMCWSHCLKKSVFCRNSPCSLFPGRSPFSVPAWTTRLLLSFLTSAAFFPPPLLQPPGACTAQTLKMGVGMSEFRCLLKRETHAGSMFCFGIYCHFCFVKLSGRLPELVGWKSPPFQSSNHLLH